MFRGLLDGIVKAEKDFIEDLSYTHYSKLITVIFFNHDTYFYKFSNECNNYCYVSGLNIFFVFSIIKLDLI